MLRIALTGSITRFLPRFIAGASPTPIDWVAHESGSEASGLDLIVELADDESARRSPRRGAASERLATVPAVAWSGVPDTEALERQVQRSLSEAYGFMVGRTETMHRVCRWVQAAAHPVASTMAVSTLILGETGTGKGMVAASIHRLSRRSDRPFVTLNCGAIPPTLAPSELFGHVKGAFTDAQATRAGALKQAADGMLFLDEISELPPEVQVSFLTALDTRRFRPVGGDTEMPFRAQLIAATNRPLRERIGRDQFRADLYYRIAQLEVSVPPLRDRLEDLPLLVDDLLARHGYPIESVDEATLRDMGAYDYDWPGNVREFYAALKRLILLRESGAQADVRDWFFSGRSSPMSRPESDRPGSTLAERRDVFERRVVREALARHDGSTAKAAEELGVTQRTIYNLIQRLGITPSKPPSSPEGS